MVIWNPYRFYQKGLLSEWFLVVDAIWVLSGLDMMLISIYDLQDVECKRQSWINLLQLIVSFSRESILMGDFNKIHDDSERMGSIFHANTTRFFNQFIDEADLIELPLGGSRFTWSDK